MKSKENYYTIDKLRKIKKYDLIILYMKMQEIRHREMITKTGKYDNKFLIKLNQKLRYKHNRIKVLQDELKFRNEENANNFFNYKEKIKKGFREYKSGLYLLRDEINKIIGCLK